MNAGIINFDIYALAQPKSREDIAALAIELIREIETFRGHWDAMMRDIELAQRSVA